MVSGHSGSQAGFFFSGTWSEREEAALVAQLAA